MVNKSVKKKESAPVKQNSSSDDKINKILVENFVSLQKVLTSLSLKFESLTKRLDNMIDLFEESAKTVVKGELNSIEEAKHTEKVLNKMDKLFEQNKLIARGLTLINESGTGNKGAPGDYNASPSIQNSQYAIPFKDGSSKPHPKRENIPPQRNSFPQERTNSSFKMNQGFKAPTQNKLVEEEKDSDNQREDVPRSPPFKDF